ncbi:uncharacterized protein LOC115730514 [Rhodamnia argentea]|uniref:Uncharacterized protein LOC115730514 n=1 Tax=Rhodamnia argentea TaxID=178133 RepID=A0ABM3HGL7_9MYRT|nr:uncharacterized protein LOC115730514 [Rhodamnia argentea]
MDNIEMIWDNQVVAESFPKLKSLFVERCNKLVTVVPPFVLGRLKSLESLMVEACGSLEVVFGLQPLIPLDGHPVALPLKHPTRSGLPKLKCVWDKELHQVKFQRLRSVSISECNSLTSLFPASVIRDLIQLEELVICECGIAELIEKEEALLFPRFDFPKLTSLKLKDLTELKHIYTGTHTSHWPALKTLTVDGCNKVEILASQNENEIPRHKQPLFLIEKGAFPNLQEFKLDLCERMEIWHGDFHDEEFFRKLRVLKFRHLSKGSATSTSRFIESLTNLEELVVCESYLEEPSSNVEAMEGPSQEQKVILPFSRQIKHPMALNVSNCDGLSSMFTPTIAENLVALTKLRISNCRILTEVLHDEEGEERREVAFDQLKCMELDGMIELTCFSPGRCVLRFPLLEDVIVNGCPNMKFFSEGPIEAPKLERVKVDTVEFWKENLNMTIQNTFKEMVTKAKFVRLFEFPELVGKWHNEHNPVNSSWQLKALVVDECPFINAMPSKLMLVLEKMTSLHVRDCKSLEEIFDLEGLEPMESTRVLPRLEDLRLINLPKLRQLWNKDLQGTMRFNSLYSLTLYKCSNLRHAFTPSMAWCLANIYRMEIRECDQMEGVIEEEEGHGSVVEKISFPRLGRMTPKWLPNLTSFLSGKNHALDCPKIEYLRIAHCPKMRSLTWRSSMDINHNTPSLFTPQDFPNLEGLLLVHKDIEMIQDGKYPDDIFGKSKALTMACFHEEKAVFPSRFLLERFQNPESLEVFRSSFEDIFPDKAFVDEKRNSVLESLRVLKLSKLCKLKRVWREDCLMSKILRSIKTLEVRDCPELTILFPAVTSFRNLTELVVSNSSGLVHLGTAFAVASLVHLTEMTSTPCGFVRKHIHLDRFSPVLVVKIDDFHYILLKLMKLATTAVNLGLV